MSFFNLFDSKKRHYKGKIKVIQKKIWDLEFLKFQLKSMREGFRAEYDRLKELRDAAVRRVAGEKYRFYYSATGDEIDFKSIPIVPDEFEKLPDEAKDTEDYRFYKKPREDVNASICEGLQKAIEGYDADISQLTRQIDGLDVQIEGQGQNSIVEKIDGMKEAIKLLKEYLAYRD